MAKRTRVTIHASSGTHFQAEAEHGPRRRAVQYDRPQRRLLSVSLVTADVPVAESRLCITGLVRLLVSLLRTSLRQVEPDARHRTDSPASRSSTG